jgi:peptidoglycan/LPS O-acetylase OafA/YrhL
LPLGYRSGLDGLRAIAVFCVIGVHAFGESFRGGGLGVDMFFVLSGFLISTIVLEELRASRSDDFTFRRFYLRRMLRLFPALYTMLAALALYALVSPPELRDALLPALGFSALYLGNVAFFWGVPFSWVGHTWSLALEEQFYVVWPAVLVAFARRRRLVLLTGLAALVVVAALVYRVALGVDPQGFLLQRPDALMVGCLLALVRWRWPAFVNDRCRPAVVGAVSLAALLALVVSDERWLDEDRFVRGLFLPVAVATAIVIGHVISQPPGDARRASPVARALSVTPLVKAGRISYGLYLWHYPVFMLVAAQPSLPGLTAGAAKVVFTFAVALASWYLVERPALRLKRRFTAPVGDDQPAVDALRPAPPQLVAH